MKYSIEISSLAVFFAASSALAETHRTAVEVPVTAVEPLVQVVTHKIPHETCRDERVRVEQARGHHSATPSLIGAVLGGVVAGSLGHNSRYKPVIAGAGAVLGASIGSDVSHRRNRHSYYVTEQRCAIDYELRDEESIVGYRVSYLYGDTIYQTRMQNHPGKTITLDVALSPRS